MRHELTDAFIYRQLVLTLLSAILGYGGVFVWESYRSIRWSGAVAAASGVALLAWTWSHFL